MIITNRHSIKQDLGAYGEHDLAQQIDQLSDDDIIQIGKLAAKHTEQGGFISKHIVMGAIEHIEGVKREPKRQKRDLSVYKSPESEPKENIIGRVLNRLRRK